MRIGDISNLLLFNFRTRRNTAKKDTAFPRSQANSGYRLEISDAAKHLSSASTRVSRNREIDQSVDLQAYISNAKTANQEAIKHAGNAITANNAGVYQDNYHAFKNALNDKYAKLAEEAKTHSDPLSYIENKYYNRACSWYAGDLSDTERRIAFGYERQMLTDGTIKGVQYQDSLFRGIEVDGSAIDTARIAFDRQMIGAQVGNILKDNGIALDEGSQCAFSVDPYSYYISVTGVDEETRQRMESALNVGENGKNLYLHIKKCATQDGAGSTQITEDGLLKYRAYHQVFDFTGLELGTLEERNGGYYTKEGKNICDIIDDAIERSNDVPASHKQQAKDWIKEMIGKLAAKGWNNIQDMVLGIDYIGGSLRDKNQNIFFALDDAGCKALLGSEEYVTL